MTFLKSERDAWADPSSSAGFQCCRGFVDTGIGTWPSGRSLPRPQSRSSRPARLSWWWTRPLRHQASQSPKKYYLLTSELQFSSIVKYLCTENSRCILVDELEAVNEELGWESSTRVPFRAIFNHLQWRSIRLVLILVQSQSIGVSCLYVSTDALEYLKHVPNS